MAIDVEKLNQQLNEIEQIIDDGISDEEYEIIKRFLTILDKSDKLAQKLLREKLITNDVRPQLAEQKRRVQAILRLFPR